MNAVHFDQITQVALSSFACKHLFDNLTMKINVALLPRYKIVFPWLEEEDLSVHAEAIKWHVGANASYEFYT